MESSSIFPLILCLFTAGGMVFLYLRRRRRK